MLKAITGQPFPIFQDKSGISLGEHWPSRLEETLKTARFLIPILTPSYFNSDACRCEAELFLDCEKAEGREDLVLPVYLIEADVLEDTTLRQGDPLARRLHLRQRADWREVAFVLQDTPDISMRIKNLADQINEADKRDRASIPPLIDEHGPFVYETRTGRAEQKKADRFKATQAEQWEKWQQNEEYQAAVVAKEALFSDETKAIVAEVNKVDEEPDDSKHPERGLVIAETTNQNLLSVVGKVATGSKVGAGLANAGQSTKQAATGFLLDSESVLKKLVASSKSGLAWVGDSMGWLRERGQGDGAKDQSFAGRDPFPLPPRTVGSTVSGAAVLKL